jgi:hypothetical protein
MRRGLPGVTVLDNEHVEFDGIRFFGTTLWSNFEERSEASLNAVRRRMGEFFFVKTRRIDVDGRESLAKYRPEDALAAFDTSWLALKDFVAGQGSKRTVIISHHAPSLQGLNPRHAGNGLDGAYARNLDERITALSAVPVWVHGHTHIKRTYRIGDTVVHANCRGFENKDASPRSFLVKSYFDL